jgi:hypothetical protein
MGIKIHQGRGVLLRMIRQKSLEMAVVRGKMAAHACFRAARDCLRKIDTPEAKSAAAKLKTAIDALSEDEDPEEEEEGKATGGDCGRLILVQATIRFTASDLRIRLPCGLRDAGNLLA